ncbi:unnamed protein product [Musa acuminata subsp. burmannicoides]
MASSFHLLPLLLCCSSLLLQRTSAATPSLLLQLRDESHPLLRRPRTKIFHPSTGLCVTRRTMADPLKLGPCSASDSWRYTPQEFLMVTGTYFCLRAVGLGAPVRLGIICDPSDSRWQLVSGSEKTHLATNLTDGTEVCLDVDSDGCLVSNSCDGFHGGDDEHLQVDSQWFKLVTAGFKKQSQPSYVDSQ